MFDSLLVFFVFFLHPIVVNPFELVRASSVESAYLFPRLATLLSTLFIGYVAVRLDRQPRAGSGTKRAAVWLLIATVVLVTTSVTLNGEWTPEKVLGNVHRLDGAFSTLSTLVVALIFVRLAARIRVASVVRFFAFAGFAVSCALFLELGGWQPASVTADPLGGAKPKTLSTLLGHATAAGGLLSMCVGMMTARYVAAVRTDSRPAIRVEFELVGLFVIFLALFLTGSRGGLAALLAVAAYVMVARVVRLGGRASYGRMGRVVLVGLLAWWVTPFAGSGDIGVGSRLSGVVAGTDASANMRLQVYWPMGLRALGSTSVFAGLGTTGFRDYLWNHASHEEKERVIRDTYGSSRFTEVVPLTGGFFLGRSPGSVSWTPGFVNSDKAHNYLLDFGVTYGYGALATVIGVAVLAVVRGATTRSNDIFSASVGVLAFIIFSMTWFPTPILDPVAYALAGLVVGRN